MAPAKVPPGHFPILYFAAAASFTGKSTEHLAAPLPLGRLFATLDEKYPGIRQKVLDSCAVTVNLAYVDMEGEEAADQKLVIQEGDEVAIIPPVSSG
ncbi:Molybdopterin synthase sulfur carrier subunit [Westerdykella ornata]|uniref:Molybdopterin synthase sulfur carrier subunit n=1 Tax=Westerdykella ornata TaxID=318751 RepID=A0A6A6JCV2_WESOR|nr:Molybdopterin synthase sulfur carrier subunit [Westerdykella ornata]KAF2274391.1 Molybdopterin synthase sulfur carrier subunit [Westerdykella ornata]